MKIYKNILILYAEIMPYNVVTFRALLAEHKSYRLHVVCWGENKKLTKYIPPQQDGIEYYDESTCSDDTLLGLYESLNPKIILISGRMERSYLKIALRARKDSVFVVGTSDNHYKGNFRQKIAVLFSKHLYRRYFDVMLVPGLYQFEYQRRIGYSKDKILFPQYCADTHLFEKAYDIEKDTEKSGILFLGRLNTIKGIDMLLEVHKMLFDNNEIEDKLIVIGDGPLKNRLNLVNNHVIYHPFMPQKDIIKIMSKVKYFCLPSVSEPWGVVIHEAAAAGLPIITTTTCGAATAFVKQGYNGYLFESGNKTQLKSLLIKMNNIQKDGIKRMGKRSNELSKQIQPEMWSSCLISLID